MEFKTADFLRQRRNEKKERLCAKYLRTLEKSERNDFVWSLLKSKDNNSEIVGCRLVVSVVQEKEFIYSMLDYALDNCNVSSIKYWLIPPLKKIGTKKTLFHLINKQNRYPVIVSAACYHLSGLLADLSEQESNLFKHLKEASSFDSNCL